MAIRSGLSFNKKFVCGRVIEQVYKPESSYPCIFAYKEAFLQAHGGDGELKVRAVHGE